MAEARLHLDEPVRGRRFTLRQLLQHRAGLRCYGTLRPYCSHGLQCRAPRWSPTRWFGSVLAPNGWPPCR
jgi:hypothetical protein